MTRNSFVLLVITACSLVALPVLAFHPSPAGAQRSPLAEGEPCPSTLYRDRTELLCRCGKTEGDEEVWGTDVYTDDSAICHAALHAGVIGELVDVVEELATVDRGAIDLCRSGRRATSTDEYGRERENENRDDAFHRNQLTCPLRREPLGLWLGVDSSTGSRSRSASSN